MDGSPIGGGAPADLGDQRGPELVALASDGERGRGARTAPGHQLAEGGGGRGARDIAPVLGQLGEGGSNLAGAGAAVELAGAVLAVLALDVG
ncbi:MAG TPA: hypothetical protein VHT91_50620 [Kofleriaceae bacterium]|jgi:hypothetical protein|nr:hypothetical protein [Kofleriaceae bacterium]